MKYVGIGSDYVPILPCTAVHICTLYISNTSKAGVTTTIRLRFDGRSMVVRLLIKGH